MKRLIKGDIFEFPLTPNRIGGEYLVDRIEMENGKTIVHYSDCPNDDFSYRKPLDELIESNISIMPKAIFLDRDSVVNECQSERVQFVNTVDDLYLCPNVAEDIQILRQMGFKTFIVTNQGGIDWGRQSLQQVNDIHDYLQTLVEVDEIVMCPHHPKKTICDCRKPSPKMILDLAAKHHINLAVSWMVGDRDDDIQAGQRAGCQTFKVEENVGLGSFVDHLRSMYLSKVGL